MLDNAVLDASTYNNILIMLINTDIFKLHDKRTLYVNCPEFDSLHQEIKLVFDSLKEIQL